MSLCIYGPWQTLTCTSAVMFGTFNCFFARRNLEKSKTKPVVNKGRQNFLHNVHTIEEDRAYANAIRLRKFLNYKNGAVSNQLTDVRGGRG